MARILIIDDDSFRRALAQLIQDCGHHAVEGRAVEGLTVRVKPFTSE